MHQIVRTERPLDEHNVLIHQLTDDAVASGAMLTDAMAGFFGQLAGRVMLAHHEEI